MARHSHLALLAVAVLAYSAVGCSRNKLTREKAEGLIKPQIWGAMVIDIGKGDEYDTFMNKSYLDPLIERGIVQLSKQERPDDLAILYPGRKKTVAIVEPTDFGRSFLTEIRRGFPVRPRTALVLARRKFTSITGIKELDQDGKSAEVEFAWMWEATEAGKRLDGVTLDAPGLLNPIRIDVRQPQQVAQANCALYDNGWRCGLREQSGDHCLNDASTGAAESKSTSLRTPVPNVPEPLVALSIAITSAEGTFASDCGSGFYATSLAALTTPPTGQPAFLSDDLKPLPGKTSAEYRGYQIEIQATADPSSPASCNGLARGSLAREFRAIATNRTGSFEIAKGHISKVP